MKLFLQEEQAGNNSNLINQKIVPIIDKLLEKKSSLNTKKLLAKFNLI